MKTIHEIIYGQKVILKEMVGKADRGRKCFCGKKAKYTFSLWGDKYFVCSRGHGNYLIKGLKKREHISEFGR